MRALLVALLLPTLALADTDTDGGSSSDTDNSGTDTDTAPPYPSGGALASDIVPGAGGCAGSCDGTGGAPLGAAVALVLVVAALTRRPAIT
jgi:hypothetical protein